jgi:hypothetical protein
MTLSIQGKDADLTATGSNISRVGHWIRVAVMFLSFGFIFPHAMTEDDNITRYGTEKDADLKKQ